jgi:hypothetical protein
LTANAQNRVITQGTLFSAAETHLPQFKGRAAFTIVPFSMMVAQFDREFIAF